MNASDDNPRGQTQLRRGSADASFPTSRRHSPLAQVASLITPRRIRAHALILALCLWSVCVIDYATPGLFDRGGNLKFQDFIQFQISAHLIVQGRSRDLYDAQVLRNAIQHLTGRSDIDLKYFYGPQVALPFILFDRLSFIRQAAIWIALSLAIYFLCVYLISKFCINVSSDRNLIALCALAYPPVFHFVARGQLSAVPLLLVTFAYLSLLREHDWLGGLALGCLVFKPQLLVAVPFVLLLGKSWKILGGVLLAAAAQMGFAYLYFGPSVMHTYFYMLLHSAQHPASTELELSAIQMHSLYSFWELLIPWPAGLWFVYPLSSIIVIALAARIWNSSSPLSVRFSSLLLAEVLVNPHIYIYDLLALAPIFLLLAEWSIQTVDHPQTPSLRILLYLSFLLPLFGPLARSTHVQLSVIAFVSLFWSLYRISASPEPGFVGLPYGFSGA